jgi:hypothetical protein
MGAVNIDNTGSGSAVTLSSDGTSLLLNGSPIGGGASPITISNKTGAYTVVAGDLGTIINCTSGTFTVSLTAAATLGSGFNCWVWNTSATIANAITIDPNGAETIDGLSTLILRRGEGTQIVCDGTNWQTGDKKTMRGYAEKMYANDQRAIATGDRSFAIGTSSTEASGSNSVAIGIDTQATALYSFAAGGSKAQSTYSTSIGRNSAAQNSNTVTGSGAMALGGSYASGSNSFAAAVANNTSTYGAQGSNSVVIGYQNKAIAIYSTSLGAVNSANATGSVAVGYGNTADGEYSFALGVFSKTTTLGKLAFGVGTFVANGDSQYGLYVLRCATTGATPIVLTTNNSAAGTTNQVILPNNSAYAFTGTVVARQQASGGTASAAWKVEGLIRREANAASTVLVASTVTAIDNTPGWTLALSGDTTNGGLAITATGAAATNIQWVATIQTSETTY